MTSDEIQRLILDVLESLRVFNTLDKLNIPEELLYARSRNLVTQLLASYDMRPLPGPYTVDFADPKIGPGYGRRYSAQGELVTAAMQSRHEKVKDLARLYQLGKPVGHGETCRCDKCDLFNRGVRP